MKKMRGLGRLVKPKKPRLDPTFDPRGQLPADAPALFYGPDIDHALVLYDQAVATSPEDRAGAMRLVMMHALRCASINLGVTSR